MKLDTSFFYMELLNLKNRKGIYYPTRAVQVYDDYGIQVVVFPSADYRYAVIVKRLYGEYKAVEV